MNPNTFTLLIDGVEVDVGVGGPNVYLSVASPTSINLGFEQTNINVDFDSPVLDVDIDSPQLVLPITAIPSAPLQFVWGETPVGVIDGVNKDYASQYLYSPSKLAVFLNGLRQRILDDYTESGNKSFSFINAPLPGDSLSIDYIQP